MKKFSIQVPATIANLGPGFDFMGLALSLMLRIDVEEIRGPGNDYSFWIGGGSVDIAFSDNAILKAMLSAAEASDCVLPAHSVSVISDIPLKKGLGSSAAARVAGYAAGKILCGKDVNPEEIALEAAIIEGHPDNVYPATLGGLVASAPEKVSGRQNYMYLRREVPDNIRFVVGIPASEVETDSSRKVLPDKVSLADVVYSSSRALLLFEALSSGKIEGINRIMDDRIHQPFRQKFIESYEEVSCAALNAGAKGVAICGSGPSIYAVSDEENSHRVGEAIVREWEDREIYSEYLILSGYSGNIGESIEKIVGFDE